MTSDFAIDPLIDAITQAEGGLPHASRFRLWLARAGEELFYLRRGGRASMRLRRAGRRTAPARVHTPG